MKSGAIISKRAPGKSAMSKILAKGQFPYGPHPTQVMSIDGQECNIDIEIFYLIAWLNKIPGVTTIGCCQGDAGNFAYVFMKLPNYWDEQYAMLQIFSHYGEDCRIDFKTHNYFQQSPTLAVATDNPIMMKQIASDLVVTDPRRVLLPEHRLQSRPRRRTGHGTLSEGSSGVFEGGGPCAGVRSAQCQTS